MRTFIALSIRHRSHHHASSCAGEGIKQRVTQAARLAMLALAMMLPALLGFGWSQDGVTSRIDSWSSIHACLVTARCPAPDHARAGHRPRPLVLLGWPQGQPLVTGARAPGGRSGARQQPSAPGAAAAGPPPGGLRDGVRADPYAGQTRGRCRRSPAAATGRTELARDGASVANRQPIRLSDEEARQMAAFLRSMASPIEEPGAGRGAP
ncbi:hypothetical protein DES47_102718 [Roseateles toxinivorans]|uniref:Uncharacterized protein n=1 Tax=Roseateles toxinivorans TaxID=270368 RepID=A0A4R6QQY9_9BURK|nr:hypothetical protein DES47_102718 [Roseateles toxinivorans]